MGVAHWRNDLTLKRSVKLISGMCLIFWLDIFVDRIFIPGAGNADFELEITNNYLCRHLRH
ncbi:hypothetical protein [Thalassoporum mexicanum]|uniref:hypothetical protein n=1 Tax=Thalassoporum mexicanum TaxID=3457544 RepID=UPI0012EABD5E|nr:hypothetical protein [Pseudanabaena sp. PCC 7367]